MSLEEQVERYYIEMENELLLNIAKKIAVDKPMEIDKWSLETNSPIVGSGGVNEWQLERLKELGGLTEENAKIIAKYSKKTKEDIEKIFDRAREIGTEVDKEQLELGVKAGILNEIDPVVEDIVVKNVISNAVNETLTTFNKQNNSLLTSAGREYTNIVNKVSTEVMAGTKTVVKAMQTAVTKLAEKGLTGFTAKNGAEWSPEAYTKMILRTNSRQTTNRIQEERMRLAGNTYVEISQHMGARPLCAEDQGKIFSLNDDTTPIEDGLGNKIKVYAWSQSSYGEPAGILGINCGHSRYAFIPSLSIHREKEIDKSENDEAYQERQTQRYYERTIRNKKREIAMLKETGAEPDYIKSKQKQLSNYSSQYNSWLNKTDRYRNYSNEWIGTKVVSQPVKEKTMKQLDNWIKKESKEKQIINMKKETGLIGLKNGNVEIKDISKHLFERKTFRDIPYEDMADAFTKPLNDVNIQVDKKGRNYSKYIGKNATLNVNPDTGNVITVWKTGKNTRKKYEKGD